MYKSENEVLKDICRQVVTQKNGYHEQLNTAKIKLYEINKVLNTMFDDTEKIKLIKEIID